MIGWDGISRQFVNCYALQELFSKGHYLVNSPQELQLETEISKYTGAEASAVTNCGMAAIGAVVNFLIQPGDCVLFSKALYPGAIRFAENLGQKIDMIKVHFIDPADVVSLQEMIELQPRFYFFEMIGNSPGMPVVNYKATLDILVSMNTVAVVDTTLIPTFHPFFQENWSVKVIEVASLSKWESEGKVAGGRISGSVDIIQGIKNSDYYRQVVMQPIVAEQIALPRLERYFSLYCENAISAAQIMARYPSKVEVFYPGLVSHPGYNLVHSQFDGLAGGIFYAAMKGGQEMAIQLADKLCAFDHWSITPSFGAEDWRILPLGVISENYDPALIRIAAGHSKEGVDILEDVLTQL
ncbi:MAG: PLP-dependent transferase [Patescibacteria group bacterium]|nr:PLP-dependent transferase [Patescibacteria group bacterium]